MDTVKQTAPALAGDAFDLLREIYTRGRIEDDDGLTVADLAISVSPDDAERLSAIVRAGDCTRTLETGMAWGLSTLAIAGVHAERGSGTHIAIDPVQSTRYRAIGMQNVRRAGLDAYVRLIEARAEECLPGLVDDGAEIDFAFIDGSHLFDHVIVDFFYVDRMLVEGGTIAFHDVWMPSVTDALAYIESNRRYERTGDATGAMVVLTKLDEDRRDWDDHRPFRTAGAAPPAPEPEVRVARLGGEATRRRFAPARPSVSLCVATRGPAARVRAQLSLLRPHFDEIVLAVDRAGDPEVLDACAALADRRLTFEVRDNSSELTGWLLNQCSADWILRLDDDELPSAALLEALPELVREREPIEIAVRRRWLYPDPDRFITSSPWSEEWQSRLLRNVPGLWSFDGRVHTDVVVEGPRRLSDLAMYHCDLVLQDAGARRAKSLAYETRRPGLRYNDFPVNGLYVPEALDEIATAPVPAEDRRALAMLLSSAIADAPRLAPAPVEAATSGDIDRYNESREVRLSAYRADITIVDPPERLEAGGMRHLEVVVRNLGDDRWPCFEADPPIRLGYRWRSQRSGRVVYDGRCLLTEPVEPGASTRVLVGSETPAEPGAYVFELDLVHEHVRWFDCEVRLPVAVVAGVGRELIAGLTLAAPEPATAGPEPHELEEALARAARLEAALGEVTRTRRYRFARALAAPLDAARARKRPVTR